MPSIERLSRQYKENGAGTVKGFLKSNAYSLTTLLDSKWAVYRMYGARAIPTVIVIDRTGVIKVHFIGDRGEEELVSAPKTAGMEQ